MRVFITGASSGLGEAFAREYARRFPGAVLGLVACRQDWLNTLATGLAPARCIVYPLDVLDTDALHRAAQAFTQSVGCPDVVIANAGISGGTVAGEPGDGAVFKRIVDVNLTALFNTCDAFVPAMQRAGRGTLVGVASVAGVRGLPGGGAYSASKAGALSYLESLRVEMHGSPIRVVTIAPGYIRTPMTADNAYPMPFLTDADVFARRAVNAIAAGRSLAVIPWQMGWVARVLRWLPNWLYDRAFARAPRKARVAGVAGPGR